VSASRGRPELDVTGFLTIGAMIATCVVVGLGLGLLLDHELSTSPLFLFIGLICGIGAGVFATWLRIRTYLKDSGMTGSDLDESGSS
jgi:F0F1-type ATP synthase assembly protein I